MEDESASVCSLSELIDDREDLFTRPDTTPTKFWLCRSFDDFAFLGFPLVSVSPSR